jgi:hypothetical protein
VSDQDVTQADSSATGQYAPNPAVDALNPMEPEMLPDVSTGSAGSTTADSIIGTPLPEPPIITPVDQQTLPIEPQVGGMIITSDPVIDETRLQALSEPFTIVQMSRPSAREVFPTTDVPPPDPTLLNRYVTRQRVTELWSMLDKLQDEVVQNVRADRSSTDAYQQDLLYASNLLLQSPNNYDEARQILFRVRADLTREKRVMADVRMYRPRILAYYMVCLALTLAAFAFDPTFRTLVPENLPILKLAFPPILFGVLGALFNGMMALHEHTTIRRDFDPTHISWYLTNPIGGGLLGLITFVFFVITGSSFIPNLPTSPAMADAQSPWIIWLVAFLTGWQQNLFFRLTNRFLKTGPSQPEAQSVNRRPPSTGPTGTAGDPPADLQARG